MPRPAVFSRERVLQELARRLRQVETVAGRNPAEGSGSEATSTGIEGLDRLLPERGLSPGILTEWLADGAGGGAQWLAAKVAARSLQQTDRALVVIDQRQELYPPAAAALGIDLRHVLVIRPRRAADALWALEQTLRCPGVGATLARIDRLDDRAFRRLQLAAEAGSGRGFLLRPLCACREPSWAALRLLITPLAVRRESVSKAHTGVETIVAPGDAYLSPLGRGSRRGWQSLCELLKQSTKGERHVTEFEDRATRRLRLTVLSVRGGKTGGEVELEIDDETGAVGVASPLAAPEALPRAAGS